MKTVTYTITASDAVNSLNLEEFNIEKNILVQVFCGQGKVMMESVVKSIADRLPHAHCLAVTTDGEIDQERISTEETVIALSLFEKTILRGAAIEGSDAFSNGAYLAETLVREDTKLLILFTDGTSTNGEAFLHGVESISREVVIAGGMAGDNGGFTQTYVSYGRQILKEGAVGIALNSDLLHIYNDFSFNWSPIGVEHTIDHAVNNRVYSIDSMNPVAFYSKYLGGQVSEALPATGIEFPLIVKKEGRDIARAVIARHADDSLSFAGNLDSGDRVRLGFGNAKMIMKDSFCTLEHTYDYPIESFFVYSCMARRRYMPDFIQVEIRPFSQTATTVGFFTYGEFYHHGGYNALMNQTFTVVALSESSHATCSKKRNRSRKPFADNSGYSATIEALTHLIDRSTEDYERQTKELEQQKHYTQQLLETQKTFIRHAIHETNTPLSVIMANIELFELYDGKHPNMMNIEVATKSIHAIYEDLSYLIKKNQVTYPKKEIDLLDFLRSRVDFFDIVAQQSQITLHLRSDCAKPTLFFNETKLQRIVDNNLSNAIKYTESAEKIHITISEHKGKITLCFSSRSLRIQDSESIFNAYYREDRSKEGLGLGLNLVKVICDEEGVDISVESSTERTTFCYNFTEEK